MRENERKNMVGDVMGGEGADGAAVAQAARETQEDEAKVKARQKQWDNKQIPDDLLMSEDELDDKKNPWQDSQGNSRRKPIHAIYFKHPRNRKTSGYIDDAQLDNPDVKKELIDKKLVTYKPDDVDQKNPFFDAHFEYGGGDNYSAFLTEMNDSTNTDPLKPFTQGSKSENHGIVPKVGVSQEQIALAFDLWEQRKKVVELKKQDEKTQATADSDGMTQATKVDIAPSAEVVEAEKKAEVLQTQLEQQTKQDQEAQKLKDLQEKKITEPEAQEMLKKLKELEKQERELRKKLANAKPEEKAELELQLKRLTQDKFAEILKALGYSQESITQLLSKESNLPIVMRLVRHTSRSKDLQSPAVREICRFAKHELISSIQELLNKDPKKQKKYSWDEVRTMKAFAALRKAMENLGITNKADQDIKINELQQSLDDGKLSIVKEGSVDEKGKNKEDTLTALLEALVTGEPTNKELPLGDWIQSQLEEFKKTGLPQSDLEKWIQKRAKEILNIDFAKSTLLSISAFAAGNFDVGAFLEMLLTGDGHSSLIHDLGYKSKEQLEKEGKTAIDIDEVKSHISKGDRYLSNSRELLLEGFKDILRPEQLAQLMEMDQETFISSELLESSLEMAVSKENHENFSINVLKNMGYTESEQEKKQITLTADALSFIRDLPQFISKKGFGKESTNTEIKSAANTVKVEENQPPESQTSPKKQNTLSGASETIK